VLTDQSDRIKVSMFAGRLGSEGTNDGITESLSPGDEVQLTITTQYGSKTTYWANVPESLKDKKAVKL
jgi:archaellin